MSIIIQVPMALTEEEKELILRRANQAKVNRFGTFEGSFQDGVLTDLSVKLREDRRILKEASNE